MDNDLNITVLKNRTSISIKESLLKLTTEENVKKFMSGNVKFSDIGICQGLTTIIDKPLRKISPKICVLTDDTLNKVRRDIDRDFSPKHRGY